MKAVGDELHEDVSEFDIKKEWTGTSQILMDQNLKLQKEVCHLILNLFDPLTDTGTGPA